MQAEMPAKFRLIAHNAWTLGTYPETPLSNRGRDTRSTCIATAPRTTRARTRSSRSKGAARRPAAAAGARTSGKSSAASTPPRPRTPTRRHQGRVRRERPRTSTSRAGRPGAAATRPNILPSSGTYSSIGTYPLWNHPVPRASNDSSWCLVSSRVDTYSNVQVQRQPQVQRRHAAHEALRS